MNKQVDVICIGGGPAGLAAALSAKENGAGSVLVLERDVELGGILQQCIHNGFGLHTFGTDLSGPEYAQRFIDAVSEQDIEIMTDTMVLNITPEKQVYAVNPKNGYMVFQAKAVILTMGCRERTRGALAIPGTRPAGVYSAGMAQRLVNMEGFRVGKKILILGSGDIGLIMARRLSWEGAEVLAVAEIMPYSSGLNRNIAQCLEDYDIPLLLEHTVTNIFGYGKLEAVEIAKVDKQRQPIPGTEIRYECDTLLLSVGLIPETELPRDTGIEIDPRTKGPTVDQAMETSVSGIYACGNVAHVHDLVDYVTEESKKAGKCAAAGLSTEKTPADIIYTRNGDGISYIVPQRIDINKAAEGVELFFRVRDVSSRAKLTLKMGDKIIKTVNKRHLAPGEMQRMSLEAGILVSGQDLSLHLEDLSK